MIRDRRRLVGLFAFVLLLFLSLACVKRLTALARSRSKEHLPGRGYRPADARNLQILAYGSAFFSIVLFLFATLPAGAGCGLRR